MADIHPSKSGIRKVLEDAIRPILSQIEEEYKKRHPDEFLLAEAYGVFMIFWQMFDEILELIIYKEARLTRTHASIIISGLGFERKVSISRSLLSLKKDKHQLTISIINRIINNAERNMLVHGIVRLRGGDARFIKRTTDNAIKMKSKTFTIRDMREKNLKLLNDLDELSDTYGITDEQIQSWDKTTDNLLRRFSTSPNPPSS